jgi:hypothetical protein
VTVYKIVYALSLLLAIVAAFVNLSFAPALLAVLGAVVAFSIIADHHVRVIVSALVLAASHAAFDGIPTVGPFLTTIIGNLGVVAGGAAVMIVLRNMYNRLVA